MGKSKVLVVGGTGYIGRRLVEASLRHGHETFVLQRPEIGLDIDKLQTLLAFKKKGARLVEGSFSDHQSLVEAVKKADVVISAMSGLHFRSHNILLQLKLIEAMKEAGNVKRFLPSEFGMDSAKMGNALEPGRVTFDEKMQVRRAIEDANIPFTYVSANCAAGYFVGNLSQLGASLLPPKDNFLLYGDGTVKGVFVDEDDIATYTVKAMDDPRMLNKTLYIRPSENILSHRQLIGMWEKLIGKELNKKSISAPEFLSLMKVFRGGHYQTYPSRLQFCGRLIAKLHHDCSINQIHNHGGVLTLIRADFATQGIICRLYHIFYDGCLTNFEVGEDEEASKLYPEVEYKRMDDYLKLYLPN